MEINLRFISIFYVNKYEAENNALNYMSKRKSFICEKADFTTYFYFKHLFFISNIFIFGSFKYAKEFS